MVLFSIPYDNGWTVKVAGEEVNIQPIAEGLLAVRLEKGLHSLELSYKSPGFYAGLILSAGSLAIYLVLCWITRLRMNKRLEGKIQRKLRHNREDVV